MVGTELTVGGWFAGAVIGNFVAKARSIMEEHHALQAEAEDMLSYAPWLQQFKDVASEAEDLLDDFETKRIREELLRKNCKVTSAASSALRFVRNLLLSDTDLKRLKDVLKKLNKIISDTGGPGFHGLMELADAEEGVSTRILPQTFPVVIGRDDEKQQLLSMILRKAGEDCTEPSNKFSVTAVIGAAGVGKTTLAQVIYNNPDVKEAFALRRWVMASHRSRCKRDIVKDIVDSFVTEKQDSLQTMPAIKNKKFFLVLDDVQDSMHEIWVFEHHAFGKHKNPSLESIEVHTVSLIYKLGQLTNLQGLDEFPVGKTEGHKITELKSLNELGGQLCISNLEEVTGIDIEGDSELFRKRYLKKLVLKWGVPDGTTAAASDGYMKTLAGLKPNANLEELKLKCYMGVGFPAWMADEQYFTKLQHIHLIECKQCKVYIHGGRGQIIKLRNLTNDCPELNMDEFKAIRKEQLVLDVLLFEGVHYLPSCFGNNCNSETSTPNNIHSDTKLSSERLC
ncbi:hypothetical protein PR202_ga29787 [Eleusine coracana subsp. coracana]|uniref:Uncharacterized protein n=1 Tax=Eleusine coracana subsp. coracana TaxID=191504 RepID=A0AAV5DN23_ELECO|nr:hypothetical protein PR202_ga29787 [Eleusine coracana subsp. coracana]